jgi:hypothetical protein
MKNSSYSFSISALMALASCRTFIGNKRNSANVAFELRKTDRSTVVKKLGPPSYISKSEALSREYWAYHANADLPGIMCAEPENLGIVRTRKLRTGGAAAYKFADTDVVFVFDRCGILVDAHQATHDK